MNCPIREECKYREICSHWNNAEFCGIFSEFNKAKGNGKKEGLNKKDHGKTAK
jgi:hypothetical protein